MRAVQTTDAFALADLMLDAYRGTIDYEGETLHDAVAEVQAYMAGERGGQPWLKFSRVAIVTSRVVGACLAGQWRRRQLPFIAYVMTAAEWKNRGVGRQVALAVLEVLRAQGYGEVRAVITEGNTPSERLFRRLGFQRVAAL